MQYNGAAVIAMAGKDCVAIASDRRYGLRNQTIGVEMQKTHQINDRTFVGLTGLMSDVQTLEQKFRFRSNMYRLREERDMSPTVFSNMVSSLLYEKRCAPPLRASGGAATESVLTQSRRAVPSSTMSCRLCRAVPACSPIASSAYPSPFLHHAHVRPRPRRRQPALRWPDHPRCAPTGSARTSASR